MAANAERALEELSLLRDRLTGPAYVGYMDRYLRSSTRKGDGPQFHDEHGRPSGWAFTRMEIERLSIADPYYVAAEMMPLIAHAADELDGLTPFTQPMWPNSHGFLYFQQALVVPEVWGRKSTTRAISWGRYDGGVLGRADGSGAAGPGALLVHYNDYDEPEGDEVVADLKARTPQGRLDKMEELGRLHVQQMTWIPDEMRAGPPRVNTREQTLPDGMTVEQYDPYAAAAGLTMPDESANPVRLLMALLLLLGQTVVDTATHRSPTPKRWRRAKLPSNVTVIRLRRTADRGEYVGPPGNVEWQHSWIVGHFWRWQPYGQRVYPQARDHKHYSPRQAERTTYTIEAYENGRHVRYCDVAGCGARVENIYIRDYVKGPPGAPLRIPQKVHSLER